MGRTEDLAQAIGDILRQAGEREGLLEVLLRDFALEVSLAIDESEWHIGSPATESEDGSIGLARNVYLLGGRRLKQALPELGRSVVFVKAIVDVFLRESLRQKKFEETVHGSCFEVMFEVSTGIFLGKKDPGQKPRLWPEDTKMSYLIGIVIGEHLSGFIGSAADLPKSKAAVVICRKMSERTPDKPFTFGQLYLSLR
ncbi:MAG: hypothetical protein UW69_C0031G0009 [Microgenomates group bacterium GW2011_GWA2_44_7]|nr:MAG: hypothetical protein UW69_C0031G0009 [Microgenomates group bacterium GW2011_GWA2_44_7]